MHKLQSELGAVGDPSPNLELVGKVNEMLQDFEHDHSNSTVHDCYLFLCNTLIGHKIGCEREGYAFGMGYSGCYDDFRRLLSKMFNENDDLFEVVKQAVLEHAFGQAIGIQQDFKFVFSEDLFADGLHVEAGSLLTKTDHGWELYSKQKVPLGLGFGDISDLIAKKIIKEI